MMFLPMLTVVAMSGQPAPQWAPAEPIVQVGLYVYQSDGSIPARAYGTAPGGLASLAWSSESGCRIGAGRLPDGSPPAHAWQFSATIVSQTADEAVIQLEWQRTLDRGQAVSGRGGSVQLTLRRGEPVPLDFASPTAGPCGAASVGFEARYEPRFRPPIAESGSGGGVGSGVGRGNGSGSGGGGAISGVSSSATTMVEGSKPGVQAGAARRPEMFDVNLWLVHTAPGREEEVRHQNLRSTPDGARFSFAPVTIDVADGQVSVQVNGSYSITENGRQLAFTTNRIVAFRPTAPSPHRTAVASSKGEGRTVIDLPGPDDVVEFGLPPFGVGIGPGAPDKFAIRVRLRPAQ